MGRLISVMTCHPKMRVMMRTMRMLVGPIAVVMTMRTRRRKMRMR